MAHQHSHPGDEHDHRGHHHHEDVIEEPLDAANQSLSDALRASFRVLKFIMGILIVLYLVSNFAVVDSHEQVLVLRLGKVQGDPRNAGLVTALPYPIDELVYLPAKASTTVTVKSHTFFRNPNDVSKPLSQLSPYGGGLNPTLDGALLTADKGLVHLEWKITYKIDEIKKYISNYFKGDSPEAAEQLIRTMVETLGIEIASELTAEEVIRTRVDYVAQEMKRRANLKLASLETGLILTGVEVFEPTPPLQVRAAFDNTQRMENLKQKQIRQAEQLAEEYLIKAVGGAYTELRSAIRELDATRDEARRAELLAQVDEILVNRAQGEAGRILREASSYYETMVGQMRSDIEEYQRLVPEYEEAPEMLIARLWNNAWEEILDGDGVAKIYKPLRLDQLRVIIGPDPEQRKVDERRRLQQHSQQNESLLPVKYHPDMGELEAG